MSLMDLIVKRRSVRRYSEKPVPKEDILKCLEAARLAPSACNSQAWHFIVVDEPRLKARVCDRIFSGVYCINKFAKEAAALVVVVSEKMTRGQVFNCKLTQLPIPKVHRLIEAVSYITGRPFDKLRTLRPTGRG
ncbi:MAG: hypothetical protein A2351_07775 [Omnitrophica bacterium RIFOXYB12_FULL_50_7]|nr:MAG: hypothetical protein A2351_07775 [Omnitrophica bacterium RIFOXYB12_FULL_50_7]